MPNMREHLKVSRIIMEKIGMKSLGLSFHRKIDYDPSLPQHRKWDHTARRFLFCETPEEIAEWAIHIALDFRLIPEWVNEF